MSRAGGPSSRVELSTRGVLVDGEHVPLLAASVHYFRLSRAAWRPVLTAVRGLGARFVDTYVPWSVHERAQGDFDFGTGDPRLDVAAFIGVADELGLRVIIRPGPHVNAELTGFGIPQRVLWDERCQARSPRGKPVVLPMIPQAFPVPSYASQTFFDEASLWLAAVARQLAPLAFPSGPITLVQVDNEGAMFFRDGAHDQDYHPDAVAQYRRFLRRKYQKTALLRAAHSDATLAFDTVQPPTAFDPTEAAPAARHLDWAEFQEAMLGAALYRFRRILDRNGLSGPATFHNLPMADDATPLDPARLTAAVDFVAADYYHSASPDQHRIIVRRTTELATRAAATGVPTYGAEMAAGFPPFFPPFAPEDNAFNVMTALAYGLRGFNVYMAAGRDRWVGGPIRPDGSLRDEADFWTRLLAAFERTHFDELSRRTPVRIVLPRDVRRWARVGHAFGPMTAAVFHLQPGAARRSTFEEPLDDTLASPAEVESFVERLHDALERARIPFGYVSGDLLDPTLAQASWTIVASSGWLGRLPQEALSFAIMGHKAVSLGPRLPQRDERGAEIPSRLPQPENAAAPLLLPADAAALGAVVDDVAGRLGLQRLGTEPDGISTTLHVDHDGRARVLFVINPTSRDCHARVEAPGASDARDALTGEGIAQDDDRLALLLRARTVRMLELSPS